MTPELTRLFLAWLTQRIAEALTGEQAAPVHDERVIATRVNGQLSQGQGHTTRTGRQSNLNARPTTLLAVTTVDRERQALGDTNRYRSPVERRRGGIMPPRTFQPWTGVTPPKPESPLPLRGLGDTPYDGSPVPTVVLLPDADAYHTPPSDPHDGLWHQYAGYEPPPGQPGYPQTAIDALQTVDPRRVGPNWFPPFATTSDPFLYGMEIPVFINTNTPYWSLPDAFLDVIPTFAPADTIKPVGSQYASAFHFAAGQGWHYTVPYAQGEEAIIVDGEPVRTYDHVWPISLDRGPVFTMWTPANEREAWTVHRYAPRTNVGSINLWRYSFDPGAISTGLSRDVTWYTLQSDGSGGIEANVPTTFTRAGVLGLSDPDSVPYVRQVYNELSTVAFKSEDETLVQGSIGETSVHGLIHLAYTYNHDTNFVTLKARFGLVSHAATSWEVHEPNGSGTNQVATGVGYALGGRLDNRTTDPTLDGPEPTRYDDSDPRTGSVIDQHGSLRLLAVDANVATADVKKWWVADGRDREPKPPEGDLPTLHYPMGVNWDGPAGTVLGTAALGHAGLTLSFQPATPPNVSTVGSFTPSNLAFASVTEGLRMAHQEVFSDYDDGVTRTLGRILTLVPPEELHAYFPPTAPVPHETGWGINTINDVEGSQLAGMIGRYFDTVEGLLPNPYGGTSGTFQGITIDGSGTYTADALTAPDGTIIGVVVHADGSVDVSEAGTVTWSGTLSQLLRTTGVNGGAVAPHARPLQPGWPFETGVLRIGGLDIVIRARTGEDRSLVGHSAPIVVSHVGSDDAA